LALRHDRSDDFCERDASAFKSATTSRTCERVYGHMVGIAHHSAELEARFAVNSDEDRERMDLQIRVRTELFNYREVKPHFINPCCFGEDFALWLKDKVASLEDSGFKLSETIQEDYGWGFWGWKGKDSFWVTVFCIGTATGPEEYDGEWGVSISDDAGLNVLRRLFHKPDRQSFDRLRNQVVLALESESAISLL
jgi:hypothetical protein